MLNFFIQLYSTVRVIVRYRSTLLGSVHTTRVVRWVPAALAAASSGSPRSLKRSDPGTHSYTDQQQTIRMFERMGGKEIVEVVGTTLIENEGEEKDW